MPYEFYCRGHENVLSTHKNTVEFTKEKELSLNGDCILGVGANFNFPELKEFIKDKKELICSISVKGIRDEFIFTVNPGFSDSNEIVIRRGDFLSERTLGIKADKSAKDIKREIVELMKKKEKMKVVFYEKNTEQ